MTAELTDAAARRRIRRSLDATLLVEAGAGSGKTSCLVERVVAVVLAERVPLRHVAAVTFTEKAAAELRDRLRAAFEAELRDARDASVAARAQEALDDLDTAAIGTLHSFALRILGEHPVEAGLPPLVEVSDEVASQVAFEERWTARRSALLEDETLKNTVLLALGAGVTLEHLRSIARHFNGEWDRLDAAVLQRAPEPVPRVRVDDLLVAARDLLAAEEHCLDDSDAFLDQLTELRDWVTRLEQAPDHAAAVQVLSGTPEHKWGKGSGRNWACDIKGLRERGKQLYVDARARRQEVLDAVLRRLAHRLAADTLAAARERQREGRLEFHDLLVLARELLRGPTHGAEVRARLHERYQRLLLDEFQDSDPIQIELAVRIAGGADADAGDWRDVEVPPGRLFVVGDPKQSVYRFRRADIATYLDARQRIGEFLELTTNFRTTPPLLAWVNAVFAQLIAPERGSQPPYRALDEHRGDAPGGSNVLLLGRDPHEAGTRADAVRQREAADVCQAIRTALAERWLVCDRESGQWRPVGLGDVAVLVPARTSLPQLEDALDRAGISYRAEASSLVYRTAEVRDLLMTARAVDDPSDALALVSALRSPVFGCGDDDLWTWKAGRGSFNLLARPPREVAADHPVREAVDYLRGLHAERLSRSPSELLDRIVRDRRMLEVAADGPRARDVWRRLRFVVDHARAWSEAEGGGLRAYLAWARRQGEESARVAEAVLPETDSDAVRIMTVHAAKGLEFPVVVLSGMSSMPGGGRGGVEVLWTRDGYELKLGTSLRTGDFDTVKPLDEQMDHHERLRLLYVACTRARDHLVVSLHRAARRTAPEKRSMSNAELLATATAGAPVAAWLKPTAERDEPLAPALVSAGEPPAYDEWLAGVASSRAAAARAMAVSASSLEGPAPSAGEAPDPGLAKEARDLELPPWNKGRYGTAIGRAVHGVLQMVDLRTGAGLDDAVAAQVLAEGVAEYEDVVRALCRSALSCAVVARAAVREHWRETYVGTTRADGTVLEGFIDLVYREDDGSLVVVDYKTDAVPGAALDRRVAVYRPQMQAYADALGQATAQQVPRASLAFLSPAGCTVREVALDG